MGLYKNTYDYAYCSVAFYELDKMDNPLLLDYLEFMECCWKWKRAGTEPISYVPDSEDASYCCGDSLVNDQKLKIPMSFI